MNVYVFDLMPWPHLKAPAVFPMPNREYDPELGRTVYKEHFDLLELCDSLGFDAICFNER